MFDFHGKIAVVTGGARGIGKCIRFRNLRFDIQHGSPVEHIDIFKQ